MIKGIIFDLDGTLLDTVTDLTNAVNHALSVHGEPLRTEKEITAFLGNGVKVLMEKSLTDKTLIDVALDTFLKYYEQHKADYTKPYKDILVLLEALKKDNYKLGIVSNKVHDAVIKLNETLFNGLLPYAYGDQTGYQRKPHADLVNLCLNEMKLTHDEVLYIGDTEVDFLTAQNSKMTFVAVTWGFRSKHDLKALKPKYMIDKPLELLNIIKGE